MQIKREIVPGLLLCLGLALPAWLLGKAVPVVGGPVFAILGGMAIALCLKGGLGRARTGTAFTSKYILQLAVVLLGFGMNLGEIAQVGLSSLPIILSTISVSLVTAYLLHRRMGVPGHISTLVGVGSSVCGCSAVAATAPVIGADDEEVAQAISVICLFNVAAALLFPTFGAALGLSDQGFGLFAGTAVNDTSSVTAAASAWDSAYPGAGTLETAAIVKLTRTLAILPITLVLALRRASREHSGERVSIGKVFPFFILFFLLAACLTTGASLMGVGSGLFAPCKDLSKFLIIMAMGAIGLNTDLVKLVKGGGRPILMGLCCWAAITAVSLGMQWALGLW